MGAHDINDELVQRIADDLRTRYALADEEVRTLGERLADPASLVRRAENVPFAERFTAEHPDTFDRLSQ